MYLTYCKASRKLSCIKAKEVYNVCYEQCVYLSLIAYFDSGWITLYISYTWHQTESAELDSDQIR